MHKIAIMILMLIFALGSASCNNSIDTMPLSTKTESQPSTSTKYPIQTSNTSQSETNSLFWMLRSVPSATGTQILYSDIPNLSDYQQRLVPPRQASQMEKTEWWNSFQNCILAGYPYATYTYIWGFDAVDLKGVLNIWNKGKPSMTVLGGHLDTEAFRDKLKTYNYQEEKYLGFSVYSGDPQAVTKATLDVKPPLADWLPRAFGVIEGVEVNEDRFNLILMAAISEDVLESKNVIQTALKSYVDQTSLAFQTGEFTSLLISLTDIGSAFVSNLSDLPFEKIIQGMDPQQRDRLQAAIGPEKLSPYRIMAVTLRKIDTDYVFEFTLTYNTAAEAGKAASVLYQRLDEGRSLLTDKPLKDYWTLQESKAVGEQVKAVVKLSEQAAGKPFLSGLITNTDYWFLYPE